MLTTPPTCCGPGRVSRHHRHLQRQGNSRASKRPGSTCRCCAHRAGAGAESCRHVLTLKKIQRQRWKYQKIWHRQGQSWQVWPHSPWHSPPPPFWRSSLTRIRHLSKGLRNSDSSAQQAQVNYSEREKNNRATSILCLPACPASLTGAASLRHLQSPADATGHPVLCNQLESQKLSLKPFLRHPHLA